MYGASQEFEKERKEIAKKLLREGVSVDVISKSTKMKKAEIVFLKKQMNAPCVITDLIHMLNILNDSVIAETVIRIILEKDDLIVKEVFINYDQLEIYAVDSRNEQFDISVHLVRKKDIERGTRYDESISHEPSVSDTHEGILKKYDIVLLDHDICDQGLPKYTVCWSIKQTNQTLEDWPQAIYVNCLYEEVVTPIGKLIHDFWCADPSEMYYEELCRRNNNINAYGKGEHHG